MSVPYPEILQQLRQCFPQPVSDRVHDAYFVFSILRALDQLDAMKSRAPLLGSAPPLDYEGVLQDRIRSDPATIEEVTKELVQQFESRSQKTSASRFRSTN